MRNYSTPSNYDGDLIHLGKNFLKMGQYEMAIEHFEHAHLNGDKEALYYLGTAFNKIGNVESPSLFSRGSQAWIKT